MKILLATGRYFQQNSIPLGCDCMHWAGFYQPLTDINVSQYEMDQKRSLAQILQQAQCIESV